MATRSTHNRLGRRWWLVALSLLSCFAVVACGPLGEDDDLDPTATSDIIAQPTDDAMAEETEVPAETESAGLAIASPMSNPIEEEGTPDLEPVEETSTSAAPVSTPMFNDVTGASSPVAVIVASPVAQNPTSDGAESPVPDGDGTSGALPGTEGTRTDAPFSVAETPATTPDEAPASSPVALAGTLAELEVVTVSDCEPASVPAIGLESTAFTTVVDVNVRSGPGVDCEALAISPVGAFLPVTVIGGPVQREGEDFVWVQVEVTGETGWIVTDALEPADS